MAEGGEMHPRGPWVGGQAMHGTRGPRDGECTVSVGEAGAEGWHSPERKRKEGRKPEAPAKPGHKATPALDS